jgi:hypothetical protein
MDIMCFVSLGKAGGIRDAWYSHCEHFGFDPFQSLFERGSTLGFGITGLCRISTAWESPYYFLYKHTRLAVNEFVRTFVYPFQVYKHAGSFCLYMLIYL